MNNKEQGSQNTTFGGTPDSTGSNSDKQLLIRTYWYRPIRYDLNHDHKGLVTPIDQILLNNLLWEMLSKAFEMYKYTASVSLLDVMMSLK